jgi:hypothetical protein
MEPHLQGIEGGSAIAGDDQLSIECEAVRRQPRDQGCDLRKEPRERLARLCGKLDPFSGPEQQTSKAVPFRLILPARLRWQPSTWRASIGGVAGSTGKAPLWTKASEDRSEDGSLGIRAKAATGAHGSPSKEMECGRFLWQISAS